MDLTKEQKEIFSKIADIKQVILSNHFDISDLTEQLISTLPFKDAIECWTEMRKHKPFSILKDKKDGHRIQIPSISDGINVISSSPDSNLCFNFKYGMESCTFDDGTPFGMKEED